MRSFKHAAQARSISALKPQPQWSIISLPAGYLITKRISSDLSINHVSLSLLSLRRPSQDRKCRHSSLFLWLCVCVCAHDSEKQRVRLSARTKPSEYIHLLPACEWMYGCLWMGTAAHNAEEMRRKAHSVCCTMTESVFRQRAGRQVCLFHAVWTALPQRKLKKTERKSS